MRRITDLGSEYAWKKSRLSSYPWLMAAEKDTKRVNIAGMGDVGMNAALGLRMAGAGKVSRVGIYDIDRNLCSRLEIELNQVLPPLGNEVYPDVVILDDDALFDCDVFLMCAAKSVPPVGREAFGDVRLAQFEDNKVILAAYAKAAADAGFKGLFGVVSDPLDLLCTVAAEYLHPEQIQGFGLGVMFARASYYAGKRSSSDERFSHFSSEGRVYGPHGSGLVAANSITSEHYDDAATDKLTNLTVGANISVRSLGYKPYIAPGISSVGLTVPAVIAGEWNDSSRYLNGVFYGARNRITPSGTKWESPQLPDELFNRIRASYRALDRKVHAL